MPRSTKKRGAPARPPSEASARPPKLPLRPGLPAQDSITGVKPLMTPGAGAAAALGGSAYRIIQTNEVDEYEEGATPQGTLAAAGVAAAPTGDKYQGTDRKAAKLSVAKGKTEEFGDLKDLIDSLPAEDKMTSHVPPITTDAKSGRVKEEQRNVRVSAFLYAASREKDNDFHLIIGHDPSATPEVYMTMEVSGLPPSSSPAFSQLNGARSSYKTFFGNNLPALTYDYYDPPIPVEVEGSLFFDMTHSTGTRPGPKSLKSRMPVIWEVHPVTKIVFKP